MARAPGHDKFDPSSEKGAKKHGRSRMVAWVLVALALGLCVLLLLTQRPGIKEGRKKRFKKVVKQVPEQGEKVRRPVPVPEAEIQPWPTEGPLPELAPPAPSPEPRPERPAAPPAPEKAPPVLKRSALTKGHLSINPQPPDARVSFLSIKSPYRPGMALEQGRYHVRVTREGYEPVERWVQVLADQHKTYVFRLKRRITTGTLVIQSIPAGASWSLDGDPAGITPARQDRTTQGRHVISIQMDGYEPWEKTVTVRPGQETVVEAALVKAGPRPGELWREPVTAMTFVWIPEGCFQMGSPADEAGRDPDEGPVHEVCLDGFWMGRTEVTNNQYRRFDPRHESKAVNGQSLDSDDQPVVQVSWHDARAFSKWLSDNTAASLVFRLPTEAEWEYACRAGTTAARFWGPDPDQACRFSNVYDQTSKAKNGFAWPAHPCDDGYAVTAPAGSFAPNAFGLYDMLGNVWEWCEDTYSDHAYQTHPARNPVNTGNGAFRVNRGGAWNDIARSVRCAVRERLDPAFGNPYVGFRLVRVP